MTKKKKEKETSNASNQICKTKDMVKIYTPYNNVLLIMSKTVFQGLLLSRFHGLTNGVDVKEIDYSGKEVYEVTYGTIGYEFKRAGLA